MHRTVLNLQTGKQTIVELTPEEIAADVVRANSAEVFNAPIISQIILLEVKWLRPFRDGETVTANAIRDQIIALRAKLKTVKHRIK